MLAVQKIINLLSVPYCKICSFYDRQSCDNSKRVGPVRDLNPGPLAPWSEIIALAFFSIINETFIYVIVE